MQLSEQSSCEERPRAAVRALFNEKMGSTLPRPVGWFRSAAIELYRKEMIGEISRDPSLQETLKKHKLQPADAADAALVGYAEAGVPPSFAKEFSDMQSKVAGRWNENFIQVAMAVCGIALALVPMRTWLRMTPAKRQ